MGISLIFLSYFCYPLIFETAIITIPRSRGFPFWSIRSTVDRRLIMFKLDLLRIKKRYNGRKGLFGRDPRLEYIKCVE